VVQNDGKREFFNNFFSNQVLESRGMEPKNGMAFK
jgi:hypothetical protein